MQTLTTVSRKSSYAHLVRTAEEFHRESFLRTSSMPDLPSAGEDAGGDTAGSSMQRGAAACEPPLSPGIAAAAAAAGSSPMAAALNNCSAEMAEAVRAGASGQAWSLGAPFPFASNVMAAAGLVPQGAPPAVQPLSPGEHTLSAQQLQLLYAASAAAAGTPAVQSPFLWDLATGAGPLSASGPTMPGFGRTVITAPVDDIRASAAGAQAAGSSTAVTQQQYL